MYGSWILLMIILISSIPVIIVYIWFRLAKYQISLVKFLFAMLAGAAAIFPALILQYRLDIPIAIGRWLLLYHYFIRIAFTEEFSRFLMLLLFNLIISRITSKETQDTGGSPSFADVNKGAAIGLVAGFGFAIIENARIASSDISGLLLRVITTALLHGACGSRVGSAAVMFKFHPIQAILRIVTATAIHGIYNLMIEIPGLPSVAAVLVAVSALASSIIAIHGSAAKADQST